MIIENILERVGDTPLINLSKIVETGFASVYGKAEFLNPMGSIKDRPALSIINAAEASGELKKGMTIVEATSGNTGLGLAMVAAVKGYKLELFIDKDVVHGICKIAEYLGATLTECDSFAQAVQEAEKKCSLDKEKYFLTRQFENPENPNIHRRTTSQEIIRDVGPRLKAFISSYGSGGTFSGVGEELKKYNSDIQLILVEPEGMQRFSNGDTSCSQIHGIGPSFIPKNLNINLFDETVSVTEDQALNTVKLMATHLGIFCGPSSGAVVHAAIKIAARYSPSDAVVTILSDRGERYFEGDQF
jgi:cysteine synthase